MKNYLLVFIFLLTITSCYQKQINSEFEGKKINFTSSDGVKITADLYLTENTNAPLILLFHQAGYSRGEYRSIAPRLNQLGYSCMAIDQRSGKEVNGVTNETYQEAVKLKKPTEYADALPDLEASIQYTRTNFPDKKIILWGSSYSSSLTLYLASKHKGEIEAILAFSPGEYFTIDNKTIQHYAKNINCPVFFTSSKEEAKKWKPIYDVSSSQRQYFLPDKKGFHGSKALWPDHDGNIEYWSAVEKFLLPFKK